MTTSFRDSVRRQPRKARDDPGEDPHHGQCSHRYPDESRCPMPGTLADAVPGPQSRWPRWWCRYHLPAQRTVRLGRDWAHERQILTEEATVTVVPLARQLLEATLAAHPEWHRGEDEARSDYVRRILAVAKPLADELGRNLTKEAGRE